MTRAKLRKILNAGGVRTGSRYDGTVANIVEFVEWWGIQPGIYGDGNDTPNIKAALDAAGVEYEIGNYVMVKR